MGIRPHVAGALVLGWAVLAGCGSEAADGATEREAEPVEVRIAVVSHGNPDRAFWQVVANGISQAAADFDVEVDVSWAGGEEQVEKMAELIDEAVATDPDGLVVTIPETEVVGPAIRGAVTAGIPVVSMNSGYRLFSELGIRTHVGQPEVEAGVKTGESLLEQLAGRADPLVLCLRQESRNSALQERCDGLAAALAGRADLEVLTFSDVDQEAAVEEVRARLEQGPAPDALLNTSLYADDVARAAMAGLGPIDGLVTASFDLSPQNLDDVRDGRMAFVVGQQPYLEGYLPVEFLAKRRRLGLQPIGLVATGPNFVTADEAALVIELSNKRLR